MRVIVVGAGIGGLAAAHDLALAGHEVVVLEGSDRIGGKLRTAQVAGVTVDVGAEAMLARRPEGIELAESVGLEIVHPTTATSRIWTRDALRPLPRSLMGVPMDLDQLEASGILSPEGMARARQEPAIPIDPLAHQLAGGRDLTVGEVVDQRFGPEVTDQLVEPLLGGVYAGRAREISVRAAVPQLATFGESGPLTAQVAAIPSASDAPVFGGVRGGMGRLPHALAAGLDVRTGVRVIGVTRPEAARSGRFEIVTDDGVELSDGLVLATPAAVTYRWLGRAGVIDLWPDREALGGMQYASVAVITFAFRGEDLPLDGSVSGFLVPPREQRFIKASTFSFAKWDWVRETGAGDGLLLLRTSVGRAGEVGTLDRTDAELAAGSLADLREAIGQTGDPVDSHVQRWVDGLPQYAVGHGVRMRELRHWVDQVPGLAVCGAAYDGVGIPAVIASAHRAAAQVAAAE